MTFEGSLGELESIVKKLETGDVELDKAMEYFKKGVELSKFCHDKLAATEESVNKILAENGDLMKFVIKS
ncbi:MAG TPA: exodeoxyribonuclease VII small subunit [Clostridiales bacterium]|nr:MAG: exodeoxyribonuclease VII small subunit [Clostridiales bacterium GWD2_32_59]HAN09160.1 exodeoxyribonuclease VII small subunit [Clostridiales bacterium]